MERELSNGEKFLKNFVMSYDPLSLEKAPAMVLPVSAELKIALTLYYLSDAGRMRKSANAFGIVKSTVSKIV